MTRPLLPARPEPESPDLEQFHIYSRREIIGVIEELLESRALVTVYFAQGDESFVTTLLHVNPEFEELVFDQAPGEAMGRRLLESRQLTFVSYIDHVKVQFSAQHAESTAYGGKPALRIRLPESLMRLQRRNYYRVPPGKSALACEIPLPDGSRARFAIGDISVGGVAVIAGPALAEFQPGTVFHNCKIELPGHGQFNSSLEIRNHDNAANDGKGAARQRFGCQFLNLSGPVVSLVQRYINQLERSRRMLT